MSDKPENPPAFPCQWHDFQPLTGEQVVRQSFDGMTLRDWFAGQAPNRPIWFERMEWDEKRTVPWPEKGPTWVRDTIVKCYESPMDHLTRWRYAYADAMLAARSKQP